MASLPKYFDNDAIAFWHIFSAYGIVVYLPAGIILFVIGIVVRSSGGSTD
jgi:hypothetical protein